MRIFSVGLLLIACLMFLFSTLYNCLTLPEMRFSYSEQKCKSIYEFGVKKSCDKLPDKYFITYVR